MSLAPGARLGSYEVLARIGAGGMGEVYRARDAKLNRDVALKILPDAFLLDPDRIARFRREAQVLASLNHPNIAAIYGLEDTQTSAASGQPSLQALVLELVDGPTLADAIASGPMPPEEALPIARQIAEALEAAHEQGIIHRDLKPANVKLRPDGTVKVLDFGLAKAIEPAGVMTRDATAGPTITSPALTQMGLILGTAAYMSPEQAKGRPADKRSDVWAFGAVLYEMLSGQRVFKGDDVPDTLAAVLRQDIDLAGLPVSTPETVRRLISRCLERDVKRRLRDIGEARILLEDSGSLRPAVAASLGRMEPPRLWRRAIPILGTAVAAAGLTIAAAGYLTHVPPPSARVAKLAIVLSENQQINAAATNRTVAISPDGAHVAFGSNRQLHIRPMSALDSRAIIGQAPVGAFQTSSVFSPDGQWLGFWSSIDRMIQKVAIGGGTPVPICRAELPTGMHWAGDDIVFGQGAAGVMRVSADGGAPAVLVRLNDGEQAYGPQILPGGETVLFTLATGTSAERWDQAQIVAQSLKSGERKLLVSGGSDGRYVPTGHIVYAVGGIVYARVMDLERLQVTGGPVPVLEGVARAPSAASGVAQFDFSSTGSLVYVRGPVSPATALQSDLALFGLKGGVEALELPPGPYQHPRAAPKGAAIAFAKDDGKEANVWVYEAGRPESLRRLTFGGRNRFPTWSADGQRIAFQSDREGDLAIFWQAADGTGTAQRLTRPEPGTSHVPESWSVTGALLFGVTKGPEVSLWATTADGKATPFAGVVSTEPINAAVSPDGRWVAYNAREADVPGVYVQPFAATGAKYQLPVRTTHPVWSRDGRELVSQPPGGLWAIHSFVSAPSVTFGTVLQLPRGAAITPGPVSRRNYDVTADRRIVAVIPGGQTPSSGLAPRQELQIVLNWFEELKQRVSTAAR